MCFAKQGFLLFVCFSKIKNTQKKKIYKLRIFILFMFTAVWGEFTLANMLTGNEIKTAWRGISPK